MKRSSPLRRSAPLKRASGPSRSAPIRRKRKPPPTPGQIDKTKMWWSAVTLEIDRHGNPRRRRCSACGSRERVEGHHVLRQQSLKRLAQDRRMDPSDLLWDPAIGMPLCHDCHERHTNRSRRVPRACVPEAAIGFAERHGVMWMIEREYPS